MTDKQLASTLLAVGELDFVDTATGSFHDPFVHIELSPRLVSVLPQHYAVLRFEKADFTVAKVIERYQQVVDHLQEVADTAAEMLRSARKQQANSSKQRFYDE